MKKILFTVASICLLFFIACNKDEESVANPTNTELLSRTWKMTALTATIEGETMNLMDSMDLCIADNTYIFNRNGSYSSEEGATKCNSEDPTVVETGTWQFVANETQLKLQVESWTFITGTNAWDILKLDITTLKLKYTIPAAEGMPAITLELTFTAL